jgi:hypothetical protein
VLSDDIELIIQRDLNRLPVLAEERWLPRRNPARVPLGLASALAVFVAVVALLGVGMTLQAAREARSTEPPQGATVGADFVLVQESPAPFEPTTSVVAGGALTGSPSCPAGQLPWIHVDQKPPGDMPGTGAASAELAFRRANPTLTQFTMYRWGDTRPASADDPGLRAASGIAWIVAGTDTFIAVAPSFGNPGETNNWFAYPAKFLGCGAPGNRRTRTAPP